MLCREGLVPFHESVGFEEYGDTVELPGRSREPLVRMIYEYADENEGGSGSGSVDDDGGGEGDRNGDREG
jgi:hypothetical protein